MSSKVAFQVHYGDFYRITHDSYGVNLSALERKQCSLDKPLENMQAPEPEPEPQGLADEGEWIPGIVEDMEKEDQDAQIIE